MLNSPWTAAPEASIVGVTTALTPVPSFVQLLPASHPAHGTAGPCGTSFPPVPSTDPHAESPSNATATAIRPTIQLAFMTRLLVLLPLVSGPGAGRPAPTRG